jgi:type I restriction enzyme S subunit
MTLETFFEKFDQVADAPDAVAKMRELIMWSAFSGSFSAEERNQPMPEEWAAEGVPTLPAIPSSWEWQRGSEVFDVIRGVSYKKNDASDSPVGGSFPVLRANNIGNGINFDSLVYVPRNNIRDEQFVRRGDILIAMSSGSKKLVGKAAPIVTEFKGAFGAFCGIIRNKSAIPDEVLARYFQSPQYTSWVTAAGRGIGINNLGKGNLDSLPIPTPPLAEQKRIVAKVDELMALCDRLETQQQERETKHAALARASLARFADAPTPANLHFLFHPSYAIPPADLRKSILTLAVQGKLVPQDPNDEPAEVLLVRLMSRDADASGRRKKSQPDLAFTADEIPFELPSGWKWERLGNIGETNIGLTYSPQDVSDVGIPVLRSSNVQNGKLDFDDLVRVKCEPKQSAMVQDGDLLICARNGSKALVGKVAVIEDLKEPAAFGAFMAIYRSEVNSYLYHFIRSPLFRQMIDDVNTTTINQITQNNLRSTLAPIPPLAEQRRIVAKVEQLMTLVDELETQLAASRDKGQKLLEAIVSELTLTS